MPVKDPVVPSTDSKQDAAALEKMESQIANLTAIVTTLAANVE